MNPQKNLQSRVQEIFNNNDVQCDKQIINDMLQVMRNFKISVDDFELNLESVILQIKNAKSNHNKTSKPVFTNGHYKKFQEYCEKNNKSSNSDRGTNNKMIDITPMKKSEMDLEFEKARETEQKMMKSSSSNSILGMNQNFIQRRASRGGGEGIYDNQFADMITEPENYEKFLFSNLKKNLAALKKLLEFKKNLFEKNNPNIKITEVKKNDATMNQRYYFGRIFYDEDQKSEGNLMIDLYGEQMPAKLIVKDLQYFLFPSQFVCVKGELYDEVLVAKELYTDLTCSIDNPVPLTLYPDFIQPESDIECYSIIVAAGPYTFQDSISYIHFKSLISVLEQKQPDLVILLGPFLDQDNQLIKEGMCEVNGEIKDYQQFFKEKIEGEIKRSRISEKKTQLMLVPSTSDVNSPFPIPQPPFQNIADKQNQKTVQYSGNPSWIKLRERRGDSKSYNERETEVVVSNIDVLPHLFLNSISKGDVNQEKKFEQCLEQFIQQSSAMPYFPIDEPLDYIEIEKLQINDEQFPEIFISYSSMKPFVYPIRNTIFINPGPICQGSDVGNYAEISIFSDDSLEQSAIERTRVDIISL